MTTIKKQKEKIKNSRWQENIFPSVHYHRVWESEEKGVGFACTPGTKALGVPLELGALSSWRPSLP